MRKWNYALALVMALFPLQAGAFSGTWEAEGAFLQGPMVMEGEGTPSGGASIGRFNVAGYAVTFDITVPEAGDYQVAFYCASHRADGKPGSASIYLNDWKTGQRLEAPDTGGWRDFAPVTLTLRLARGTNTLTLRMDEGDLGDVNLDYLTVTGPDQA